MLVLNSPAKLNLFLRVLGKRSDGFHEIASLFQAINLYDTLSFRLSSRDAFSCTDPSLPLDENNLVIKALHLFKQKTGLQFSVEIHLEKKIPILAGLGGGSGNAATTLWGLNELLNRPATVQQLESWSKEIGSDIPFFFTTGTAYVTGRGELLKALPPLQKKEVQIIKPSQGLSSGQVFRCYDPAKSTQRCPQKHLENYLKGEEIPFNDLEEPAFIAMPELQELKAKLQSSGFEKVCMTGSGSAFFCFGSGQVKSFEEYFSHKAVYTNRLVDQWYNQ